VVLFLPQVFQGSLSLFLRSGLLGSLLQRRKLVYCTVVLFLGLGICLVCFVLLALGHQRLYLLVVGGEALSRLARRGLGFLHTSVGLSGSKSGAFCLRRLNRLHKERLRSLVGRYSRLPLLCLAGLAGSRIGSVALGIQAGGVFLGLSMLGQPLCRTHGCCRLASLNTEAPRLSFFADLRIQAPGLFTTRLGVRVVLLCIRPLRPVFFRLGCCPAVFRPFSQRFDLLANSTHLLASGVGMLLGDG
jgi:hypothetical protein